MSWVLLLSKRNSATLWAVIVKPLFCVYLAFILRFVSSLATVHAPRPSTPSNKKEETKRNQKSVNPQSTNKHKPEPNILRSFHVTSLPIRGHGPAARLVWEVPRFASHDQPTLWRPLTWQDSWGSWGVAARFCCSVQRRVAASCSFMLPLSADGCRCCMQLMFALNCYCSGHLKLAPSPVRWTAWSSRSISSNKPFHRATKPCCTEQHQTAAETATSSCSQQPSPAARCSPQLHKAPMLAKAGCMAQRQIAALSSNG